MKISTINDVISIIANIGVIASIVFLGFEMRQNSSMMLSQTRNEMTQNQMETQLAVVENSDYAKIHNALRADPNAFPVGSSEALAGVEEPPGMVGGAAGDDSALEQALAQARSTAV